ncbi:MAG: D-alanyl-D-alanine carboxypeptidase, partial [Rhodocyclaceae bacterium]|nr:D-alanyl-D-alanine carboxypeptidase [Rhodocyclaceae bacterium]
SLYLAGAGAAFAQANAPDVAARAWALWDMSSEQLLAGKDVDAQVEPASLTKIMTSYLGYAALRDGRLKRDQQVSVSEKAWKAIGSRMFIAPNLPVTVDQLLHGIVIQSGNDASIALAEAVAGTEEAFVAMMNAEAKRLGLSDTHFANATGLPDPQHYSTAQDLARLTAALIRDFPEDYKHYALKEYTYNKIRQPNRNRLLWLDERIDGVKTGHTETAGFCLIASRFDGARRLTAVVLGTASDQARAQETLALLHYGFRAYEAVKLYDKGQALTQLKVFKGKEAQVRAGFAEPFVLSLPRGVASTPQRLKVEVVSRQPLLAPIRQGETIATLRLAVDGQPYGEYPLVALADVPVAGLLGRAWDGLRLMLQ